MTTKTTSNMLCATLLALTATGASAVPPPPDMVVHRASLSVKVCNVTNAETSDAVRVSLNDRNVTVLNSPSDDFTQGSMRVYDLLPFIPTGSTTGTALRLSDITRLQVLKNGSNGVMLCQLTLNINDRTIYDRAWQSPGYLLDDTAAGHFNALTIPGAALRASSYWQNYGNIIPLPSRLESLPVGVTKKRMEALFATAMHGKGNVRWRGSGVSVVRKDATAIRVRVDLEEKLGYENWNPFYDRDVDIDFDLRFSCSGGIMTVRVENYAFPSTSVVNLLSANMTLIDALRMSMLPNGSYSFRSFLVSVLENGTISFRTHQVPTATCPQINVDSYGNVDF